MKELTSEELASLTEFAKCYLSIEELAEIMECDVLDFRELSEQKGSTISKAIRKGRLQAKAEVQKALLISATNGSSPAQEKMLNIMKRVDNSEV